MKRIDVMTQQDRQIEVGDLVRYDNPSEALLPVWEERKHEDSIVVKVPDTGSDEGWYTLTSVRKGAFDSQTWSSRGRWLRLVAKAVYERLD